jgi:hypothetical protein
MPRRLLALLPLVVLGLLFVVVPGAGPGIVPGGVCLAEEADDDAEPIPPLATEEEAEEALKAFKSDYRARGYRGDEKTAMREVAMRKLTRTQHPEVADQLFKLTKDRDPDIRTLALLYLGEQRAIPGYAGPLVVKALKAHASDAIYAMFAVEALENLDYRGAVDAVRGLLTHKDEGVRKVAILYIGDAKEWRMLEDLLKLMKEMKIDKGWKTEGHEVRYDTGTAGDHDQKMAEKIYRDKYGSSARKARSGGRAMRDMKPVLLEAMKNLTGVDFAMGSSAREWAEENEKDIEKNQKALDDVAKEQAAEAEALD